MRFILSVVIIVLLMSCSNNGEKNGNTNDSAVYKPFSVDTSKTVKESSSDSEQEYRPSIINEALSDKITNRLIKIPFVKESNDRLDSLTNHEHGITFIFDSTERGFQVKAGYNGPDRFENYYTFDIDPVTLGIKINDVISGEWISIKEYIRRQRKYFKE